MTESAGVAIRLRGVTKRYGLSKTESVSAADNVDLDIEAGSFVALSGASGSGKSTLLHLIGAIDSADSGTITVDGVEVTGLRGGSLASYRRSVGFVFQRYNLLPSLTALDNVISPVLPYRTKFDKQVRGRELLAAVGLSGRERSLPSRMSGGEQQRIAIARALVNMPSLVLADEPTGNLDSANAGEVLDLLAGIREERGITMLIATHDPQVAARCKRLVRLKDGGVVEDLDLTEDAGVEETIRRVAGIGKVL